MTDKKLTDNEIIKALECCSKAKLNDDCRKLQCPFFDNAIDMCGVLNSEQVLIANALDLINRLQAENSNLQEKNLNLTSDLTSLQKDLTSLQAYDERLQEAIDEQDIEIARLWKEIERYKKYYFAHKYDKWEKEIKAEAYKEFAEQLDAEIESSDKYIREYDDSEVQKAYNKGLRDALKVLKELVGDSNG